jgi:curved DNA-binding protein CbpA
MLQQCGDAMKTYYEVLGLIKGADDVVVKAAYRALVQKYHPDKQKFSPYECHHMMTQINAAYGVLGNKNKRKLYDEYLKGGHLNNKSEPKAEPKKPAKPNPMQEVDEPVIRAQELVNQLSQNALDEIAVLKLFEEYFECSVRINNNWVNSYTVILNGIRQNLDYLALKKKLIQKISEEQV